MLRVAGSLQTGKVRVYDLLRMMTGPSTAQASSVLAASSTLCAEPAALAHCAAAAERADIDEQEPEYADEACPVPVKYPIA
ncbi:hypothetical protein [Streptomyces sp. NPDC058240]|uniref:hypothetical protein n=1 Tax=Streptomyces sp. NPDC058240 TaxID=3346396 RepID=UPI0036E214B6